MSSRLISLLLTGVAISLLIPHLHDSAYLNALSRWMRKTAPTTANPSSQGISYEQTDETLYRLGGTKYFTDTERPLVDLPFIPPAYEEDDKTEGDLFPVTVIPFPDDALPPTPEGIEAIITSYLERDDVFNLSWLATVVFMRASKSRLCQPPNPGQPAGNEWLSYLSSHYGTQRIFVEPYFGPTTVTGIGGTGMNVFSLLPHTLKREVLRGPYSARVGPNVDRLSLFPVYRLYSDTRRTFLFGIYPRISDAFARSYKALRRVDEDGYSYIPVPSRLYSTDVDNGVDGQRIAVKDMYDIKGVITSGGCRAYGELYGPANESAVSIRLLEENGGDLVGKTKTAAFAWGGKAHHATVDEHYPFSARADLWQSCLGSSSGSACAMGAYEWLDFALGTDTSGSVRGPAGGVGLYGNRPSTGAVSGEGVILSSDYADTMGVLARDPISFGKFIRTWYRESPLHFSKYSRFPSRLLVDGAYLEQALPEAQELVDDFVRQMASALGMQVVGIDLAATLSERYGSEAHMKQALAPFRTGFDWSSWTHTGKPFTDDYRAAHQGHFPPLDPLVREGWDFARTSLNESLHALGALTGQEFGQWFHHSVIRGAAASCSDGILVYDPGSGGLPMYRESQLDPKFERKVPFRAKDFCSMAGCVDITVPIGQVPFSSVISLVEEMKPVTVGLIAGRGFMLQDVIDRLNTEGILQTVKAGRTAF